MSLFAGIHSRNPDRAIAPGDCQQLRSLLSRFPDEHLEVLESSGLYIVSADVGGYRGHNSATDAEGRVTVVAGEPLIRGSGISHRAGDIRTLHAAFVSGEDAPFASANGTYCAVHHDPEQRSLTLAADRLGLRPLYYCITDEWVVFSSAFRVLECSTTVPKRLDLRGVTEHVTFGYALGRRTPYADVSVLLSGEHVHVAPGRVVSRRVWRWDRVPRANGSTDGLAAEARSRFRVAVERRLAGDENTIAFLSGGLDSRSIVTVLRTLGVKILTFSFGAPDSQDSTFARAFAQAAGCDHHEAPRPWEAGPRVAMLLARELGRLGIEGPGTVDRSHVVWSGDGGSVGLGHVYLNKATVEHARAGREDLVVRNFVAEPALARRLLTERGAAELLRLPVQGVLEELEAIEADDPGRATHVFLMHNDQRRHLAAHFEDIDLHRMEFHLPFFDADFLEVVLSVPVEDCLGHGFYMQWLSGLPPLATSTPWQTYPGHEPCPLPIPIGLTYQWGKRDRDMMRWARVEALERAKAVLRQNLFPTDYWRRGRTRLANLLLRLRVRDTAAALSQVATFARYWERCQGKVSGR